MTTYYEKRGRRYYPIAESDAFDAIPEGYWLVSVKPGLRSARRMIKPAYPEIEAAIKVAQDAMLEAMYKVRQCDKLDTSRISQKDRERYHKAFEAWKAIVGDVPLYFEGVSMNDVIEAGLDALRSELKTNREGANHDDDQALSDKRRA